jgi:hypothetical protein
VAARVPLAAQGVRQYLNPLNCSERPMTPELENMVESIKQSVGLLRRRL